MTDPIKVSVSPVGPQLWSALRDLLKVIGTILATKGLFDERLVEPVMGLAMVVVPIVWSQITVRFKHSRLLHLAHAVDDGVAVVK